MEWLANIEDRLHRLEGADSPFSRDMEKLIAAVRLAERKAHRICALDAHTDPETTTDECPICQAFVLREALRSGEVEDPQ